MLTDTMSQHFAVNSRILEDFYRKFSEIRVIYAGFCQCVSC